MWGLCGIATSALSYLFKKLHDGFLKNLYGLFSAYLSKVL